MHTKEAVQETLDHCLDILRLNHRDDIGVRGLASALFIRLGKDEEAYRFIKWWHLNGGDASSELESGGQPYVDIEDAKAFEPVNNAASDDLPELSHLVALTLLELRMAANLRRVDISLALADELPPEVLDSFDNEIHISPLVASNDAVLNDVKYGKKLQPHIDAINLHLNELIKRVDKANEHFWPALINLQDHNLSATPQSYSRGSIEEMRMTLKYNYRSWTETPAAIGIVKERLQK